MRTFYDYRGWPSAADAKKYPVEGRVILKSKKYWLCWIYKSNHWAETQKIPKGYIVAPRTIYLYDIYIATSFWNALKYFIKVSFKKKTK